MDRINVIENKSIISLNKLLRAKSAGFVEGRVDKMKANFPNFNEINIVPQVMKNCVRRGNVSLIMAEIN